MLRYSSDTKSFGDFNQGVTITLSSNKRAPCMNQAARVEGHATGCEDWKEYGYP